MLTIGCHLSTKGGYLEMAKEALSINANTFQYFTRNPRGGAQKALDEKDIDAYKKFAAENNIEVICAYAPYDVEPANPNMDRRDFTLMVLSEDLLRLQSIPGQLYLVRPGSAPEVDEETAIQNVSDAFNKTLSKDLNTTVLIDTQAGEGHQVGYSFEQIAKMLDGIELKDKMGVCIDCAAIWAAGYDIVNDLDGVLTQFDQAIGLNKLKAIHLNDSKEKLGSRVNRHARIGKGQIGFDALAAVMNHPSLQDIPFYIEEPDSTLVVYEHDVEKFKLAYTGK